MNSEPTNPTFKVGLTPEEKKLYTQLFKSLDPTSSGIITGETARATFEKSNVLPPILGEIWQIADQNNLGYLSQFGFCQAMRLIGYAQAGQHPTAELADYPGPLPKFSNLEVSSPLQAQFTNNSFMNSQPTSIVPQNTTTLLATPQDPITAVSQADYDKFSTLFAKTVGSIRGELSGNKAKDIFLKAKLPTPTLGHIWNLVDRQNSGKLSVDAFVVAMHLIQGLLGGTIKQLPPFLPESLWLSVNRPVSVLSPGGSRQSSLSVNQQLNRTGSVSSRKVSNMSTAPNDWVITPLMKQQYDSIFSSIDTAHTGTLDSSQVASFLMKSNLNQQDLATIWDLSDIQNTGTFGKTEFAIAVYLVNRKLAGEALPNVIPSTLIDSLNELSASGQNRTTTSAPAPAPAPAPKVQKAKTSMDDLVDIFGSPSKPQPTVEHQPSKPPVQRSTSELSNTLDSPKVRKTLTGSFKPTSNFGQTLLNNNLASPKEEVEEDLLGEDVQHDRNLNKPQSPLPPKEQRSVNYEALRAVPTPPVSKPREERSADSPNIRSPTFNAPSQIPNNDLLADTDPEISGKLSQANTDIANVSTQIKSLTGRTTDLHDKKLKAQQELSRILKSKEEIESKLVQLRTLYDNEVQQVDVVEKKLQSSREESEALRSEASISEAKLNALTGELDEKRHACEVLQQENEALKQKLAQINSGIVDLEKNLEEVAANNQALNNQVSVKKSQVQVSLVKSEDLKAQITKLQEANKQMEEEILKAEKEKKSVDEHNAGLEKEVENLKSYKPEVKANPVDESHSKGVAAASAVGVAGLAGIAGATISSIANKATNSSNDVSVPDHSEVNELPNESSNNSTKESPATVTEGNSESEPYKEIANPDEEHVMKRFPDLSVEESNNRTAGSSIATDYYKNDDAETPVTSPSNSDFQFQQDSNQGIPGGMVGMPGVLLGILRTDSLTSSVQNNAALSVRDDNIGEMSDRDTLENEIALDSDRVRAGGYKHSPGTESFEMVNADEIKSKDSLIEKDYEANDKSDPQNEPAKESVVPQVSGNVNDEFPPIQELDYDESSSDDESQVDKFDDAVDHLPGSTTNASVNNSEVKEPPQDRSFDDFDNQFDNLEPAAPEDEKDEFEDNFIGMEEAQDDNLPDEFSDQFDPESNIPEFSEGFTGTPNPNSNLAALFAESGNNQGSTNDEWEQLFAGFGNSQAQQASAVSESPANRFDTSIDQSHQEAIHELVGMGFEENVVINALERENWDLESATNYLLDNA